MDASFDIDSLRLFLVFVLPGLISMRIYRLVMPAGEIVWSTALLEGLFYSSVNFALLSPLIIWMHYDDFPTAHPVWYSLMAGVVLFVGPIAWPLIYRRVVRKAKFFRQLQLPYPSAWDYYFSKRTPVFVLIHLKTGKLIGGYFGIESYATSYPHNGDIYLQAVYKTNEDGTFGEPIENSDGLVIRKDEYHYIEFFTVSEQKAEVDDANRKRRSPIEP